VTAVEGAPVVVQEPYMVFAAGVCFYPGETVVGATDDELTLWRQAGWVS
jgi:hypothetical protein